MKRLLNTLYVTTQGAYLNRDGETVAVNVEHTVKLKVPIHTLEGIVCFGQISCSPHLMQLCAERGVAVSFLSENGRFWARVEGPVSGNVLLRREQYRKSDEMEGSRAIAGPIVAAKIFNQRSVLMRSLRDHPGVECAKGIAFAAERLGELLKLVQGAPTLDDIRGIEGEAAKRYFSVFDNLILAQKQDFFLRERSRRPPLDNMNAMLSFIYTLLVHDVRSALETVGLDPAVGFLHRDRPGRPSLALDLVEELRPVLADRLALSLVNRQQVKGKGFMTTESGAVRMDDDTRKELILAYQKRKKDEIVHPFINEKIEIGLVPYVQSLLMSRFLRGDIEGYPPFFWR